MAITAYVKYGLIGGAPALDGVDGAGLLDGDVAFAYVSGFSYFYVLDDDIGGAESSPDKITPDANAGDKRWVLQGIILPNAGLKVLDTNGSHCLIIKPGSDLSADRILTITTGDAARTLTLAGDVSISTFAATMLDDAAAGDVLTTLGVSTYAKTLLDDADAATAVATLGLTATAAEINTACDGSTAKNNHTHAVTGANLPDIVVGDIILLHSLSETSHQGTTYTKVKEIQIKRAGTYRVSFDLMAAVGIDPLSKGRIYKNGVAYGTERSGTSAGYVTFSEDLAFVVDDLIQIYTKGTSASYYGYVKNFILYGNDPLLGMVNL